MLLLNHLMYADDLGIFLPYSGGLQMLLNICSEYSIEADVKYNAIKNVVMIMWSKYKNTVFPNFILTGAPLSISTEVKYLGHYMTVDFRDDMDINRQCRKLYDQEISCVQLMSKLNYLEHSVPPCILPRFGGTIRLFSIRKLNVAYNDIMRLLLCLPRYHSASQLFANIGVPAFQAVIRNLVFIFITRLDKSDNVIIQWLVKIGEWSQVYFHHMEALV